MDSALMSLQNFSRHPSAMAKQLALLCTLPALLIAGPSAWCQDLHPGTELSTNGDLALPELSVGALINQSGDLLLAQITQEAAQHQAGIEQAGSQQDATILQSGQGHMAYISQSGELHMG